MGRNDSDMLEALLDGLSRQKVVPSSEFPAIDLYMDQVTGFMDHLLGASKRHPEDKILTKTMINNYTKNKLLPPPVKKKYGRGHLLLLYFIYYLKSILSIADIGTVLKPFTGEEHKTQPETAAVYDEVFSLQPQLLARVREDVTWKTEACGALFADRTGKEKEDLQEFALICALSYDVYCKKSMIEKLVDERRKRDGNSQIS